jgi:very-short-patch-repair endonuclease
MKRLWNTVTGEAWHHARTLRKSMTCAERAFWHSIRPHIGDRVRRQHPIGPYILDFCIPSKKIAIEIDGDTHVNEFQIEKDIARTLYLESLGWKVVRFTNGQVKENPDYVVAELKKLI